MTFEAATLGDDGSPPITRIALSIVPCPLPRRAKWVRSSIASPSARSSPVIRRVGARISTFEACLDSHSRYGPMFRSTAQGGLCHEASARPVAQPSRSSATRSIDNSLGGTFLHWRCAPSGRTDYGNMLAWTATLPRATTALHDAVTTMAPKENKRFWRVLLYRKSSGWFDRDPT